MFDSEVEGFIIKPWVEFRLLFYVVVKYNYLLLVVASNSGKNRFKFLLLSDKVVLLDWLHEILQLLNCILSQGIYAAEPR